MPKGAAAMKMGGLSAAIGAGLLACGSLRGWNLPRPHGPSGSGRVRPDPFQPCSPPTVAGAAPALHPVRKALRRPSRMRTGFPFHPGDDLPGTSMKRIVPKIWGSSTPRTQYVAPSDTLGHHGKCCANAKRHGQQFCTPCSNTRQVPAGKGFSKNIHVAWMLHDRPSERGRQVGERLGSVPSRPHRKDVAGRERLSDDLGIVFIRHEGRRRMVHAMRCRRKVVGAPHGAVRGRITARRRPAR